LAIKNGRSFSMFSEAAGTIFYMSPDVLDEKYTYNSDVW